MEGKVEEMDEELAALKEAVREALMEIGPVGRPILAADQARAPEASPGQTIARWIDHTLLHPQSTPADVERVCHEARTHGFASVVVNPVYVEQAVQLLEGTAVLPASVVGFPLGGDLPWIKVEQANALIQAGVRELDMVLPVGLLLAGDYRQVAEDMRGVLEVCHPAGVLVKVILETGVLDRRGKIAGTLLAMGVGADYVKTCTGFAAGGATVEDIRLMRSLVGDEIGVKAAGGIRSLDTLRAMLEAGASRIGARQGVSIMDELAEE